MKLKKLLLRYHPPGIILQYDIDGQTKLKPIDLLDLTPDADIEVSTGSLLPAGARLGKTSPMQEPAAAFHSGDPGVALIHGCCCAHLLQPSATQRCQTLPSIARHAAVAAGPADTGTQPGTTY